MKHERGFTLIEVLISLAILGVVAVAFLGGLSSASKGLAVTDERQTAQNLAEASMEYVKNEAFGALYPSEGHMTDFNNKIVSHYPGYDVDITAVLPADREDGNIQKIVVTVWHGSKQVLTLEDYKVR